MIHRTTTLTFTGSPVCGCDGFGPMKTPEKLQENEPL